METVRHTGYPSADKPWMRYYDNTASATTMPSPECSVDAFLRKCNRERLEYVAIDYFGAKIRFCHLFKNIDAVAAALQKAGLQKGDIISLLPLNTPEFIYLLYAATKIGVICNWLGLTSPASDLRDALIATNTEKMFVVDIACDKARQAAQGTQVKEIISVPLASSMPPVMKALLGLKNHSASSDTKKWRDFLNAGKQTDLKPVEVTGSDPAMIEYTGGSTGIPKGVVLSNHNLNSYYTNFKLANDSHLSDFQNCDTYLSCVPLFLAFGASCCCHAPLCHGMSLVLAPDPSPDKIGAVILKRKPNHIIAGRIQIDGFLSKANHDKKDLSFIKTIMYGGEAANNVWAQSVTDTLAKYNAHAPVVNGYGMTETAACILIEANGLPGGLIPLGNVCVKVTDPDDPYTELSCNTEGELCFSSDTVMAGYYHKESETEDMIFTQAGQRWLRTRDLAVISEDGMVHITGRIKRIYHKLSSDKVDIRVYPLRIESVLTEDPMVEKCAVVGIPDEITAYRTIAFIILKENTADSTVIRKRLSEYCTANLPTSHIPDEYVFVDEFPITRAGKVDYRKLEENIINR